MATDLSIRAATSADLDFIVEANAAMALETEHKTLDPARLARGVAAVFEQSARGFYLVAERGGRAVGCLMVTREWSDWRAGDWWWLQSVYVCPTARRTGVFRALHDAVTERAAATPGVVGLRLYVERDNVRAQATYAAIGLSPTAYLMYEREDAPEPARHGDE